MRIFKCKHKEYRVIACDPKDRHYTVKCIKCGAQWQEPKAVGEEYDMMRIYRREQPMKFGKFIKNFYYGEKVVIKEDEEILCEGKVWDVPQWLVNFKLDNDGDCEACMLEDGKITIYVKEE